MRLILAEKPSIAWDIARVLGQPQKHDGFFTIGTESVSWAYGHLVTLADPSLYDPAWKRWTWSALPMIPESFQLQPILKTQSHLQKVLRLMRQAKHIVCATDGDREGELIFRYIYALAKITTSVDRLWLSENTPEAIEKALETLKPLAAYDTLARAAEARAQADWLIGLNATRAFSLRHSQPGHPLSVGRVQTPTLRLIRDRDDRIKDFLPTPYWQLTVTFQGQAGQYPGIWQAPAGEHPARIATEEEALRLASKLPQGTPGYIDRLEVKRVTIKAPLFFNLNDLQKEANRKFGLTAQQTLDAAQSLYDHHLTSYPRTEARVVTAIIAKTLPNRVKTLNAGTPSLRAQALSGLSRRISHVIDDQAVIKAGHYAIIPTDHTFSANLSRLEQQIFDLIELRFLAAMLPMGRDERTTIRTIARDEQFKTTGNTVLDPGWRAVYSSFPDDNEENLNQTEQDLNFTLPSGLKVQDSVQVLESQIDAKETKPPPRFTDASLLSLMERHALGTPATRSRILEVLLMREYVRRDKKSLVSTEKGRNLLNVLPEILQSPDLTGDWETRLEKISQGEEDPSVFTEDIRRLTHDVVIIAEEQTAHPSNPDSEFGPCPLCHQGQIVKTSKGWGCSRWQEGCRFMIWNTVAGKRLTSAQVKSLLRGKTTGLLKGFKNKNGKSFDARLQLQDETGHIVFVFSARPRSVGHKDSHKAGQ